MTKPINWHETDPVALSRWLRTPRRDQTPAEYACSVEGPAQRHHRAGEYAMLVLVAVAVVCALVWR